MAEQPTQSPLIYIVAGEASGDNLAASLMDAIKAECPGARFAGIGGPEMTSRGIDSLFAMSDLSVMGIAEVLPKLRLLLKRIAETAGNIMARKPDVVVTVDSPDFSFRVAKRLKGRDIPLAHFVAPSVWAWRPGRAAKIAGLYDHLFALLPFEPPYFEKEGLPTTFVGHPVMSVETGEGDLFRREHQLDDKTPLLCILPGSRRSEVTRLLPVFLETFAKLQARIPELHGVIPAVPHLAGEIKEMLGDASRIMIVSQRDKFDALAASTAALAASGTIALELAVQGVPSVIAYKVNVLTAFMARRMITIPYKSLVNILMGREVMPERIQEDCTSDILSADLVNLLENANARTMQLDAFAQVRAMLTPDGEGDGQIGANIAAREVLRLAGVVQNKN